jgi:cobalt-precorrin 5A hydrolase
MNAAVIALTPKAAELAMQVSIQLNAHAFIKPQLLTQEVLKAARNYDISEIKGDFTTFVGYLFRHYEALVFIMACGIVVRSIAPYIRDKSSDPAVIVMDEKCRYAISLLSGHIGGANRLALHLAEKTGAIPVITTATDINEIISFDVFAVDNDCEIENIKELKFISSGLLRGEAAEVYSEYSLQGNFPSCIRMYNPGRRDCCNNMVVLSNRTDIQALGARTLYIRPRNLVLGVGCKRGTSKEAIREAVKDFMNSNKRSMLSLKCVATIDLKKDEKGILEFCSDSRLELKIVPREDIAKIEDAFQGSEFVKQNVGVASVAEPCAILACKNGTLVCTKKAYSGITLALSEEEREYFI